MSHYRDSYQFISLDETRSKFWVGDFDSDYDVYWTDYIVRQGKQIRTVETLLYKGNGVLCGFKWIGDDGAVLVAVGKIDDPDHRNQPYNVVTTLTLNHNQRLVGIRSASNASNRAMHY